MNISKTFKKLIFVLLMPLGYLILYSASLAPNQVENIYSRTLYRVLARPLNILTGYIPFSIAEILVISCVLFILYKLVSIITKTSKSKPHKLKILFSSLINFLMTVSIVYFCFVIIWGINYQRISFAQIAHYDTQPASVDELAKVCQSLTAQANTLRESVNEDGQGVMKLSTDIDTTLKRAYKGYEKAGEIYTELSGWFGRPKGVMLSGLMSYTGIEGVYFPFTGEANINVAIPHSGIPATTCHEMAHQRGFSREDEANYIAYLSCKYHPDEDFRYSGALMALTYATNALYKYDKEKYWDISKQYSEGIKRDLNAVRTYWQKYETPVQDLSSSINNTYLKANLQKDGVRSYGRMVDLLIAEQRQASNR